MKIQEDISDYPQHEILKANKGRAEVVGDFLDWLEANDYEIGSRDRFDGLMREMRIPEQWIADFIGVDREAFSAEKDRMLEEYRKAHGL